MYFIRSIRCTSTLFVLFATTTIFTLVSASSAFSVHPSSVVTSVNHPVDITSRKMVDITPSQGTTGLRLRGGTATSLAVGATSAAPSEAPKSGKKIRIQAFDSMRFFLIIQIVLGHFISFANPSPAILKFFSQHNVLVGAFFALSGYVTVCLHVRSFHPAVTKVKLNMLLFSSSFFRRILVRKMESVAFLLKYPQCRSRNGFCRKSLVTFPCISLPCSYSRPYSCMRMFIIMAGSLHLCMV